MNRYPRLGLTILALTLTFGVGRAATLFWAGGTTDIANGTPLPATAPALSGRWDATTKNWCSDTNALTYVAWSDGADMVAFLPPFPAGDTTATITQAVDVVLNQINAPHYLGGGYNHAYSITATSPQTITLTGVNPTLRATDNVTSRSLKIQANVKLVAANGLIKTGVGNVWVYSDSPAAVGKATIYGAAGTGILIQNTGKLLGITEFDVQNGGGLSEVMGAGANNRIDDAAVIRLRGHGLVAPSGTAGATEAVRQLILNTSGAIALDGGSGKMIFTHPTAGIDRGVDGKAPLYFSGNATDTFLSYIVVSNGVPSGVPLPWAATLRSRPVQLNATTLAFEPMAVTAAPNDVTTWISGTRYRLEGNFIASGPVPTTSIASLGVYYTNTTYTLTIGATDTLTLAEGQISFTPAGGQNATKTITGGQITSGLSDLYILTGNSSAAQIFAINSALVGNMNVIKGGAPLVTFGGTATNTYTGTTYVNHGQLKLLKTTSQSAIPGDVVINAGGTLYLDAGAVYNINTNANVTIREGGTLQHNNSAAQAYSGTFTFNGGTMSLGGSNGGAIFNRTGTGLVFSNGGTLTQTYNGYTMPIWVLTDVRYDAACTNRAYFTTANTVLQQYLDLSTAATGPATRTYDVADAVGLASTTSEMTIDVPLRSDSTAPVSLVKTGTGVLSLERLTGRFGGGALVTGGTLLINGPFATQTVQSATTVNGNATLSNLSTTNGLRVGQLITGTAIPANTVVSALTGATTLTMSANATGAGTSSRTFWSSGALGTGSVVVATSGTLGGVGGVAGTVTVNAGGTLNPGSAATPKGVFAVVGKLDLSGGGTWQVDIDGDASNDQVQVVGDVTLGGTVNPNLLGVYNPLSAQWIIGTYTGTATGAMSAPAGYRVSIDSGSKQILLNRSAGGMVILVR